MLLTSSMLIQSLSDYANPACRLERLVRDGKYIRVIRGLYETDPKTPGHYLAQAIRNPSYLSFEWALAYYGLIPEAVPVFTSATYITHRSKMYDTPFGHYWYRDVAADAYPYHTRMIKENGYTWWIAEPEKAICDELYIKPPVYSLRDMEDMLFDDMRMDESELMRIDIEIVKQLSVLYGSSNVKLFSKVMEKMMG
ncbi:MAG: hypothetical protein IJT54_09240 [Candidatus Methanomethylophilaceae archaeon]|nr:hypothetical protein [Candidatus Methanomethylophilaceae archaeon]